jgi:hypothetical protein
MILAYNPHESAVHLGIVVAKYLGLLVQIAYGYAGAGLIYYLHLLRP